MLISSIKDPFRSPKILYLLKLLKAPTNPFFTDLHEFLFRIDPWTVFNVLKSIKQLKNVDGGDIHLKRAESYF